MVNIKKSSYRQVFKATSIFGGVQVFNILIGIIRSKIVAVLLGTSGYGYMGLLNAPVDFIKSLTGLGIGFSAVRDISAANETGDQIRLSSTLKTFRRWVWVTGLLGMFTVLILSPRLSQWSFGDKEHTWAFVCISITLLILAVSGGQSAVLRGMRRIKDTAKAGVWGSAIGLLTSVPLYWFFGLKGIVPAIIISACTGLFLSWYFSRRVKTVPVQISYKESYQQGKQMVKLGVMLTLTGLIGSGVSYLVITFIGNTGGMSEVGLYNAGWAITNQYVGLVFAAMGADYYPRLAGIHQDNIKIKDAVNQQAEIAVLIIAPIMLLYLTSLPVLIPLFYTRQFLSIIPFTQWVVLGMLFKAAAWAMGFIILAKGDTRLFLVTETIANVLLLACNIGGYYLFGLQGIGIGFVILYFFDFFLILIICRKKYEFGFTGMFSKIFIMQLLFCTVAFLIAYFFKYPIGYISGGILLVI
jgi:O-antigen/teichoic acid export membrane protein